MFPSLNLLPSLPPWGWIALASIPIGIVALYFLKLRREPVAVPSTYLWATTIEDLHVNSLFQRLRRSVLLLLQLLAVLLAAVALLRPGRRGDDYQTTRRVFLIDRSASMSAADGPDGRTRLQTAIDAVGDRIDAMDDDETAMIVAFSDRSQTLQPFTSDRTRLRAALERVGPTADRTDVRPALSAADGLANPRRSSQVGDTNDVQVAEARPADLLILSDGGFGSRGGGAVDDFSLGNLVPQYLPMGRSGTVNVAVTAFSASRDLRDPGVVNVFAAVAGSGGDQTLTRTATLRAGDQFLDAATVEVEPGDTAELSFQIESDDDLRLSLSLDAADALPLDDVGYTAIRPAAPVRILVVGDENTALTTGLNTPRVAAISRVETLPREALSGDAFRRRAAAGTDDLIIFDRCRPADMPAASTLFIGEVPPASSAEGGSWSFTGPAAPAAVVDVDRGHPLMRYLELFSLLIASARPIEGPESTEVLVEADIGPVIAVAPRDGYQDCVVSFALFESVDGETVLNTNWYAERSWPVFLLNAVRTLAGGSEVAAAPSFRPGDAVRMRLPSTVKGVTVRRYDVAAGAGGEVVETVTIGPGGLFETTATDRPGVYELTAGGRVVESFAVNLFDAAESDLAVAPELSIGYEPVAGDFAASERRYEYWRWALLGMLGLIAGEWWVYSRRIS